MFECVPKTPPWPLKKKEIILYDFTYFYNFINWPVFIDTGNLCIIKYQQSKYHQRYVYFLCIVALCLFPFVHYIKFSSGCFKQVLSHLGKKKLVAGRIRQVVVLCSNDYMGNFLGKLSIGSLRQVVVLQRWLFEHV